MNEKIKPLLHTIVFLLIVGAVFMINSFIAGKLNSIIPTYEGQAVSHGNARQISITDDSFSYRDLMLDKENITLTDLTEQEYEVVSNSEMYSRIVDLITEELGETASSNKESLYKIMSLVRLGTNEAGEKKYYIIYGYRDKKSVNEIAVEFDIEAGLDMFVHMENIKYNMAQYTERALDNALRQELVKKAKQYLERLSDKGLIKDLPELYFPIKYITKELNICYIQDNTSQFTIYYDIINDKIIGFQRNSQAE